MRDGILYSIVLGFISGVLIGSLWPVSMSLFYFILLLSLATLKYYFLISKKARTVLFISFFLFSVALGIFRFNISAKNIGNTELNKNIGQKISLIGIIDDEPSIKEKNTALTIRPIGTNAKLLATVKSDKQYQYGDKVKLSGTIDKPENFVTDQGKEFDYVHYLRKDGIFYVSSYPAIEIISHGNGSFVKSALFNAKEKFLEKIGNVIPKPESTLMGGLILGERSSFSAELRQSFVDTGTIHIIALSGYNVTIISSWIMQLLSFLPRAVALGGGIFTIILFIIMTGGSSTAIRAGVMASLALFAKIIGRKYTAGRALLLAGVGMVILNPYILVFDVSFQLSFLATIAVIYLAPIIEKYFLWIKWQWLRNIVSLTVSAYIFVMPFILYTMGNLSLVALPTNIAILPVIEITMIVGFITGFVGFISPVLSFLPGHLAYYLLHYELSTISFFSKLKFASISIPDFPLLLTILVYVWFAYVLYVNRNVDEEEPIKTEVWNKNKKESAKILRYRLILIITPLIVVLITSVIMYYPRYQSAKVSENTLKALLIDAPIIEPSKPFIADLRTQTNGCEINGPYPDHDCTPGAIFTEAKKEKICVPGYTKTVRSVSTALRKRVYVEYNIAYPVPFGTYEVDHFIPLALGGSNDIGNLFPEAAEPKPGFKEKDVVEVYLHDEVCAGHVALSVAQEQIATDWLRVYENLSPDIIKLIKQKYSSWAN